MHTGLFPPDTRVLDASSFTEAVMARPFLYPSGCAFPSAIVRLLQRVTDDREVMAAAATLADAEGDAVSAALRRDEILRGCVEQAFETETALAELREVLPIFFKALSEEESPDGSLMSMDGLERITCVWGRDSCSDDPVMDWDAWLGRMETWVARRGYQLGES